MSHPAKNIFMAIFPRSKYISLGGWVEISIAESKELYFFFLFMVEFMVYGSSQARDGIPAAAVTYTIAAAMLDP